MASCAAVIAALPPPTAPPVEPVGAGDPEATPLTVSPDSNASFSRAVQRKAELMPMFPEGPVQCSMWSGPQWLRHSEIAPMAACTARLHLKQVGRSRGSTSPADLTPFSSRSQLARLGRRRLQSRSCAPHGRRIPIREGQPLALEVWILGPRRPIGSIPMKWWRAMLAKRHTLLRQADGKIRSSRDELSVVLVVPRWKQVPRRRSANADFVRRRSCERALD